ncbi:MAG: hypothetical protein AMXMBFR44_3260 [Candidatus Campbellbacteria bacterium]
MRSFYKKIIVALLFFEAKVALWMHRPRIVGVTGSVGKTSTKDAIASVARQLGSTRASAKSYNSELGLPLTILGLETAWGSVFGWARNLIRGLFSAIFSFSYPKLLVLELGVDHPGDMDRAIRLLSLDTAVITHIGEVPVHVEFFESARGVLQEKAKIIRGLSEDSVLILTYDDERVRELKNECKCRVITFGRQEGADVHGDYYNVMYDEAGRPTGVTFKVLHGGNVVPIVLSGVLGKQTMYPSLAAAAFGITHDLNLVEVGDALSQRVFPPGRMRVLEGLHGTTIIDDTYNASPIAVREALTTLKDLSVKGKKIAVLGDMAELGELSEQAHEDVGSQCAGLDVLVTVGNRMRGARDAAKRTGVGRIESFENARDAGLFVKSILKEGDIVLFKGSQSMRVERAVGEILAHPEKKHELLVRQGGEWGRR